MPGSIKFCNRAESQEGRANLFFTERLGGEISLSAGLHSDGCQGGDSERQNEEVAPQQNDTENWKNEKVKKKKTSNLAKLNNKDGVEFFFCSFVGVLLLVAEC